MCIQFNFVIFTFIVLPCVLNIKYDVILTPQCVMTFRRVGAKGPNSLKASGSNIFPKSGLVKSFDNVLYLEPLWCPDIRLINKIALEFRYLNAHEL